MPTLPPLKAMQAFEAAARHLSIKRAADELCVTPSAVSHQIRLLEEHLKVQLFHRISRRIILTDTGSAYAQVLSGAFLRMDSATRTVVDYGYADVLTVHCPPTFAPAWLLPRLTGFTRAHPEIDIRVKATPEPVDFNIADVEVRYGNGDWPEMEVLPLMAERIDPICSPAMRATLPVRPTPADMLSRPLIHSERQFLQWPQWFAAHGMNEADCRRGLRFDRAYLSIQAAAQGMGIALESAVFAARELASGSVVFVFEPDENAPPDNFLHHLVYPKDYAGIPKVQSFRRWLVDELGRDKSCGVRSEPLRPE